MSSFEDIQKKIAEDLENRKRETKSKEHKTTEDESVTEELKTDTGKVVTPTTSKIQMNVISKPGTEVVRLDTSIAQWMECDAAGDVKKHRYCIVSKQPPRYPSSWVTSEGYKVSVVTEEVFMLTLGLMRSLIKQLQDSKNQLHTTTIERDSYKLIIDAFRKNNIID